MNIQEAKQQALDEFDFDKAAEVYRLLDWKWWDVGVPGPLSIRNTAERLLEPLGGDVTCVKSGGLSARLEQEDEDCCYVELEFTAVTSSSDLYEKPA